MHRNNEINCTSYNIDGPDESTANEPKQIDKCIEQGYDVEIDVRYDPKTERLWLGHDEPKYAVTWWWLAGRAKIFGFIVKISPPCSLLLMARADIIIFGIKRMTLL